MYEKVEVWTIFGREDEPEVYSDVHDTHIGGVFLLLMWHSGDQIGIPLNTIRRWKATRRP